MLGRSATEKKILIYLCACKNSSLKILEGESLLYRIRVYYFLDSWHLEKKNNLTGTPCSILYIKKFSLGL